MTKNNRKLKELTAPRVIQPTRRVLPPPPRDPELSPADFEVRRERLDSYEAEIAELRLPKRFASVKWERRDLICILALADVFAYFSHCDYSSVEDLQNWLGIFLVEILHEVASIGPECANARPQNVIDAVDTAVNELRQNLKFWRTMTTKLPPSVLEEIDKWTITEN